MIISKEGNILNATEDIIAYQVNCAGQIDGYIMTEVMKQHLRIGREYLKLCKSSERVPGSLLGKFLPLKADDKIFFNLFCEVYPGDSRMRTNYEALEKCIRALAKYSKKRKLSVAIPYRMASTSNGFNWHQINDIINRAFLDWEISIYKLYQTLPSEQRESVGQFKRGDLNEYNMCRYRGVY